MLSSKQIRLGFLALIIESESDDTLKMLNDFFQALLVPIREWPNNSRNNLKACSFLNE